MTRIIFYEKPGCIGNGRQKSLLRRAGHALVVRDMLAFPWTAQTLRPFFEGLAVQDWLNPSASRVKSGEIDPAALTEAEALALLIADPILIRRPLMEAPDHPGPPRRMAGFRQEDVSDWLGLDPEGAEVGEGCPRGR